MAPPLRLTLRSSLEELTIVADQFDAFAAANHVSPDVCNAMQLALEEVITNVIKYGYRDSPGSIDVEMDVRDDDIIVTVVDASPEFNPLDAAAPNLDLPLSEKKPGGLGIHLVKALMDSVVYERIDQRNKLTLRKYNGDR